MEYKGHEEIKNMNKRELLNRFKDEIYPDRTKGKITIIKETNTVQRKHWRGEWYDYELTSTSIKELAGTNMSQYRPVIGDDEYTWGQLEKYPAAMVRIFLYQYLTKYEGHGEEE
jgi:hypothetical protein